jgi:hypothetical protein
MILLDWDRFLFSFFFFFVKHFLFVVFLAGITLLFLPPPVLRYRA